MAEHHDRAKKRWLSTQRSDNEALFVPAAPRNVCPRFSAWEPVVRERRRKEHAHARATLRGFLDRIRSDKKAKAHAP